MNDDPAAPDGEYLIDPDGPAAGEPAFSVTCDMAGGGWTVLHEHTFTGGDPAGWLDAGLAAIVDTVSDCAAAYGAMLGGVGLLGKNGEVERTFDLRGVPHAALSVSPDSIVMDSWDGEDALVYLDGAEVYRETFDYRTAAGGNVCAGGWPEHGPQPLSFMVTHTADALHVRVSSTLDQPADDESFGVSNVVVRVR